jgi:hypothetical protein
MEPTKERQGVKAKDLEISHSTLAMGEYGDNHLADSRIP